MPNTKAKQNQSSHGDPIQALFPRAGGAVLDGNESAPVTSNIVRVLATSGTPRIRFGVTGVIPTANDLLLIVDSPEYFSINQGELVAVIDGDIEVSPSGTTVPQTYDQYIVYENSLLLTTPTTYQVGSSQVRKRIIGNVYQVDVTLTAIGFSGAENIDWVWVIKHTGQTAIFRAGVRDGDFVVDGTIDGTGFAGTINVNWENINTAAGTGILTTYRDGVRDESYVIDKVLTATGFDGDEDIDWENLRKHKPE